MAEGGQGEVLMEQENISENLDSTPVDTLDQGDTGSTVLKSPDLALRWSAFRARRESSLETTNSANPASVDGIPLITESFSNNGNAMSEVRLGDVTIQETQCIQGENADTNNCIDNSKIDVDTRSRTTWDTPGDALKGPAPGGDKKVAVKGEVGCMVEGDRQPVEAPIEHGVEQHDDSITPGLAVGVSATVDLAVDIATSLDVNASKINENTSASSPPTLGDGIQNPVVAQAQTVKSELPITGPQLRGSKPNSKSSKRRFVLYDDDSQGSPLVVTKAHREERSMPAATQSIAISDQRMGRPATSSFAVRRTLAVPATPLPHVPNFDQRSPSSQQPTTDVSVTEPPSRNIARLVAPRSSFVRPVPAAHRQLSQGQSGVTLGPQFPVVPSVQAVETNGPNLVATLFSTGSGKVRTVSKDTLSKVAADLANDLSPKSDASEEIPLKATPPTISPSSLPQGDHDVGRLSDDLDLKSGGLKAESMVSSIFQSAKGKQLSIPLAALVVATEKMGDASRSSDVSGEFLNEPNVRKLSTAVQGPNAHIAPSRCEEKVVNSIFTSGTDKQLTVSTAALQRAAQVVNSESDPASSSSSAAQPAMVQSIFSTAKGKQLSVSSAALDRAARIVMDGSEPAMQGPGETVNSIFTSGKGTQMTLSTAALARAARIVNEDLPSSTSPAPVMTPSTASGKSSGSGPKFIPPRSNVQSTVPAATPVSVARPTTKQFVRPRASTSATPGTSVVTPSVGPSSKRVKSSLSPLPVRPLAPRRPRMHIAKSTILSHAVHFSALVEISSGNAANVSFAIDRTTPMLADAPCMWTLSAMRDVLMLTFVDKRLTLEWVANHFRFIVWKLACMERLGDTRPEHKLCFANVVQQLTRRSEKEFHHGEDSAVAKIVAGELPARALVVVVLARVLVSSNPDGSCVVEVSDGWYGIEAILDEYLAAKVRSGKFVVGQKFMFSHCRLDSANETGLGVLELNCNRILSPPTGIRQPRLLISVNASKPCAWDTKLGYRSSADQIVSKSLAQIRVNGGIVPRSLPLFICRLSLLMFREKLPNGTSITRNQQEEDVAAQDFFRQRNAYRERATARFMQTVDEATARLPRDGLERLLEEFIANDAARPALTRKVSTVLRLIVKDASMATAAVLSVQNPGESLLERLREGALCAVSKLTVNRAGNELRLFADEQSQWRFISSSIDLQQPQDSLWVRYGFPPRSFQPLTGRTLTTCDTVLVWVAALTADANLGFAIAVNPNAAVGEEQQLVAISFSDNHRGRLQQLEQTACGTVVAARDLSLRSLDSATNVLNAAVLDITCFNFRPVNKVVGQGAGFAHLVEAFEWAKGWTGTADGKQAIERAVQKCNYLLFGEGASVHTTVDKVSEIAEEYSNQGFFVGETCVNHSTATADDLAMMSLVAEMESRSQAAGTRQPEAIHASDPALVSDHQRVLPTLMSPGAPPADIQQAISLTIPVAASSPRVLDGSQQQMPSFHAPTTQQQVAATPPISLSSVNRVLPPQTPFVQHSAATAQTNVYQSIPQSSALKATPSSAAFKLILKADALSLVMVGKKTIEARVNRGIVRQLRPGSKLRFESGMQFQDVIINAKREYASFKTLVDKEDLRRLSPRMPQVTEDTAIQELSAMHGSDDMEFGAVALEFQCCDVPTPSLPPQATTATAKKHKQSNGTGMEMDKLNMLEI